MLRRAFLAGRPEQVNRRAHDLGIAMEPKLQA